MLTGPENPLQVGVAPPETGMPEVATSFLLSTRTVGRFCRCPKVVIASLRAMAEVTRETCLFTPVRSCAIGTEGAPVGLSLVIQL